jgi:metallo-beta-lactamase class B
MKSALFATSLACAGLLSAQGNPAWREPFEPHKVIDNIYYVGTKGLSTYLITSPEGHIVINSSFDWTVPMIRANIEKLGFKFSDVKILLISHAHGDHCAGSALFKELTGATYMVMAEDVPEIEKPTGRYPAVKVDQVLKDGDDVKLGNNVLTARLTPGHTKGCTTWTMKAREGGKTYDVVIIGSPNVNAGYKLVNNEQYPQIAEDYERMFRIMKSLKADVYLGAHGDYYGMEAKFARMKPGAANPFIDPDGYKRYISEKEQEFRTKLAAQKAEKK